MTAALLPYYEEHGLLRRVDGVGNARRRSRQRHLAALGKSARRTAAGDDSRSARNERAEGDKLEFDGVVEEALPNAMFRVKPRQRASVVLAHRSAAACASLHHDCSRATAVTVEVSPVRPAAAAASRTVDK